MNVFGTVNLTRKVLKHFSERNKGHVVVTSSMAGKMGNFLSDTKIKFIVVFVFLKILKLEIWK